MRNIHLVYSICIYLELILLGSPLNQVQRFKYLVHWVIDDLRVCSRRLWSIGSPQ